MDKHNKILNSKCKKCWRIFIIFSTLAILLGIVIFFYLYPKNKLPKVAPLPEKNAQKVETQESKLDQPSGGGAVNLTYKKFITVNSEKNSAELYFLNPPRSNQSIVIFLNVCGRIIAKTGSINPGNFIEKINISDANFMENGHTYEGILLIGFYYTDSGQKAVIDTSIPVTLSVKS